jgi:hypothetical protein
MKSKHRTIRIWTKTWRKLKILAALTESTMVRTLDILIDKALKRQRDVDEIKEEV